MDNVFAGEPVTIHAILNKAAFLASKRAVSVSLTNTLTQERTEKEVQVSTDFMVSDEGFAF